MGMGILPPQQAAQFLRLLSEVPAGLVDRLEPAQVSSPQKQD
jgi:hypothetical protein